jgi:hypothetical protein
MHFARTDPERIAERRQRVKYLFKPIVMVLTIWLAGDTSMEKIRHIAEGIAATRGIPIDRLARRTKDGMICWLCENAPELALGFAPTYLPPRIPHIPICHPPANPVVVIEPRRPPDPKPLPVPIGMPSFDDTFRLSDNELSAEDDGGYWGSEN